MRAFYQVYGKSSTLLSKYKNNKSQTLSAETISETASRKLENENIGQNHILKTCIMITFKLTLRNEFSKANNFS